MTVSSPGSALARESDTDSRVAVMPITRRFHKAPLQWIFACQKEGAGTSMNQVPGT